MPADLISAIPETLGAPRLFIVKSPALASSTAAAACPELARFLGRMRVETLAELDGLALSNLLALTKGKDASVQELLKLLTGQRIGGMVVLGCEPIPPIGWDRYSAPAMLKARVQPDNRLSPPVSRFFFSERRGRRRKLAVLRTPGDLAEELELGLLQMKYLGQNSLDELRAFIDDVRAHNPARPLLPDPRMPDGAALYRVNPHLMRLTSHLELSYRAHTRVSDHGIQFVGELVSMTAGELLEWKNCSRKTVSEISARLNKLGLCFGTPPTWLAGQWAKLAATFRGEIEDFERSLSRADGRAVDFLEDELRIALDSSHNPKHEAIVLRLLGWGGAGAGTLSKVGKEFGLSRERIRQIAKTVLARRQEDRPVPLLEKALALIAGHADHSEDEIQILLQSAGLTRNRFRLSGIKTAATIMGLPFSNPPAKLECWEAEAKRIALQKLVAWGVSSVGSVREDLKTGWGAERSGEEVRNALCASLDIAFLDAGNDWFWSDSIIWNPAFSRIKKILAIARRLEIQELAAALLREPHMRRLALPGPVLHRLCQQQDWCAVIGSSVLAHPSLRIERALSPLELKFVQVLLEHGGVLPPDRIRQVCREAGMNDLAISNFLCYTGLVTQFGNDLFGPVGSRCENRQEPIRDPLQQA